MGEKSVINIDDVVGGDTTAREKAIANEGGAHHLGVFSLKELASAFDEADVTGGVYDVVTNNCASFLINMAGKLGIDPSDSEIASFVARNLARDPSAQDTLIYGRTQS